LKASIIKEEAAQAASVITAGGLVLYPTDTIWGIGCDATDEEAVQKIYALKRRSDSKSMLVLMKDQAMLAQYLESVPPEASILLSEATKPTTIIYPGARKLASGLLAEDGSVGIRLPADDFCQELITLSGLPMVSTSANLSGQAPPSLFGEIGPEIMKGVDHVVAWRQDDLQPASPSAIVKITKDGVPLVLRP